MEKSRGADPVARNREKAALKLILRLLGSPSTAKPRAGSPVIPTSQESFVHRALHLNLVSFKKGQDKTLCIQ